MSLVVLDSSAALAWVLPGELDDPARDALARVAEFGAIVPSIWRLEIANVLLMQERRRRIGNSDRASALVWLESLRIDRDDGTQEFAWTRTIGLASDHGLTVYDASYLEVALRRALPLASRDEALRRAAALSGVIVLG